MYITIKVFSDGRFLSDLRLYNVVIVTTVALADWIVSSSRINFKILHGFQMRLVSTVEQNVDIVSFRD
jgi:hypothetical protein